MDDEGGFFLILAIEPTTVGNREFVVLLSLLSFVLSGSGDPW